MKKKLAVLAVAGVLACGFGWFKKDRKPVEAPRVELPAGYALLFKLLSDEKDVSKLFIVKRGNRELHDLIKDISASAGKAHKALERLGKSQGINLEDQQLPGIEVAVRESMSKEKAKKLLSTKKEEFELNLLLTQSEALAYGRHIATALADRENAAENREFLVALAAEWAQLESRVFRMLSHLYQH